MTARKTNVVNVFETTLTVAMAPTDLTATVSTTTNGPASPALLVIEPDKPTTQLEIIYFDGTFTGTTFVTSNISNRYLTGSAAASGLTHPINSKVRCAVLSQHIIDIYDYIDAIKAIATTAGDVLVATGSGAYKRLPLSSGAAYKGIGQNASGTDLTYLDTLASLLTTQGDTPYASAANTPARLGKGTAGQVYAQNDALTAPLWVNTPPLSDHKPSVRAATTGALATGTYSGGVFTVTANGALAAQDGVTLVAGDRLLVKNQASGSQNGIYTVTTVGTVSTQAVLTRATDFDTSAKVTPDAWCMVEEGTTLAGSSWRVTNTGTITLDTTALTFGLVPAVAVSKGGTLVGRRGAVNLIEGTNVTMTVADNSGSDRVDVTINASGGGGYGTLDHTQAYSSSDQAITTGTETKILLQAEDFDTSNQHSTVSSTGDIVIATTGVYEIDGVIAWDSSTAGTQRYGRIKQNSTIIRQSTQGPQAYAENNFAPFSLSCTAGDVIALFGGHDKGSNMSVFSNASVQRATFLRVKRLS